jgi:hypothetical protein
MLRPADQNARYCYEKALDCQQRAGEVRDSDEREFWLDRQRQWLHLGASYEYQQWLSAFLAELSSWPKQPFCSVCDVPMRAKRNRARGDGLTEVDYNCPKCEAKRTLVEIEGGSAYRQPLQSQHSARSTSGERA